MQRDDDDYWPPPREALHRTTIETISLHNLPKRTERRPRFDGSRGACHKHHPELSGAAAPPDQHKQSSPALTLSLHPIGGFCAVSKELPLPESTETEASTAPVERNGMNATFRGDAVCASVLTNEDTGVFHCVAAEPHATFLRVAVTDRGQEVAYESAVLGRLRRGYRVFQMRGPLLSLIHI